MPIPNVYGKSREQSIATYDYVDVEEGTGVVLYYGMRTGSYQALGQDASYAMTRNANTPSTLAYVETTAAALLDENFDLTFNMPKVVKGDVLVCIPVGFDGGSDKYIRASGALYHIAGASSALLASAFGDSYSGTAATTTNTSYITLRLNAAETTFKAGDTLRVNLDIDASSPNNNKYVGHDPLNRNPGVVMPNSQLKFLIPFKLTDL